MSYYYNICSTHSDLKLKLSSTNIKYLLFDCDGLLLDTESLYTRAAIELIQEYLDTNGNNNNKSILPTVPEELKLSVMGRTKEQIGSLMTNYIKDSYKIEVDPADWTTRVTVKENHLFSLGCDLLPGAQDLINHTKSPHRNLPIVLATSSYRSAFLVKSTKHSDFFEKFDFIICGDELDDENVVVNDEQQNNRNTNSDDQNISISKSKPHPKIFEMSRLKVSTTINGIVFEDSLNGVIAGLRSGHPVIWIPSEEIKHVSDFNLLNQTINNIPDAIEDLKKYPDLWVFKTNSLLEIMYYFK